MRPPLPSQLWLGSPRDRHVVGRTSQVSLRFGFASRHRSSCACIQVRECVAPCVRRPSWFVRASTVAMPRWAMLGSRCWLPPPGQGQRARARCVCLRWSAARRHRGAGLPDDVPRNMLLLLRIFIFFPVKDQVCGPAPSSSPTVSHGVASSVPGDARMLFLRLFTGTHIDLHRFIIATTDREVLPLTLKSPSSSSPRTSSVWPTDCAHDLTLS
jgi:hypothetical protein